MMHTRFSSVRRGARGVLLLVGAVAALAGSALSQTASQQKISDTEGGFTGALDLVDFFGRSVSALGDLDGDGGNDLVVGAHFDGDGGTKRGAVWVLFLDGDGTVLAHQKISATEGGFTGPLDDGDLFGASVAMLDDVDGDGVPDLAVGAPDDDDGGSARGAVWLLFLRQDGTVGGHRKISSEAGGFTATLDDGDLFGSSLASLGDFDGDGTPDLAVGACGDGDGGPGRGAVWLLFLNRDGTVKAHRKISDTEGEFVGGLNDDDAFGDSVAFLGDVDLDGTPDLAVGVAEAGFFGHPPAPPSAGALWVLFLNPDGTTKRHQKIGDGIGGFTGELDLFDRFGAALAAAGDLDGDGVGELVVGAPDDDDGGTTAVANRGALWLLFLDQAGTVRAFQKISAAAGGFTGALDDSDRFGTSIAPVGDLDGDGLTDWAVGAPEDDDGGSAHGAVWVLFLEPTVPAAALVRPGDPPNPAAFLPGLSGPPVAGEVWEPAVAPFLPDATADFAWVSLDPVNLPTPVGTLLCGAPLSGLVLASPAGVPFQLPVPANPAVLGWMLCAQGGSLGPRSVALANALDITVGSF